MKFKNLFLSAIVAGCCSCSPTLYQQVSTITSDNLSSQDNVYQYRDGSVTISYNFWRENGIVAFAIQNTGDKDIYIDMSKSFLIKNGEALDYYKERTYSFAQSVNVSAAAQKTESASVSAPVTATPFDAYKFDRANYGESQSVGIGVGVGTEKGIEMKEQRIICIPAHCHKVFAEYNVSSTLYRECGFIRNPKGKKSSIRTFEQENSPLVFINRITVIENGKERTIDNNFYISQIQNFNEKQIIRKENKQFCGQPIGTIEYNKEQSNNKFFIPYKINNGQTDNGKGNSPIKPIWK